MCVFLPFSDTQKNQIWLPLPLSKNTNICTEISGNFRRPLPPSIYSIIGASFSKLDQVNFARI